MLWSEGQVQMGGDMLRPAQSRLVMRCSLTEKKQPVERLHARWTGMNLLEVSSSGMWNDAGRRCRLVVKPAL